MHKHRFVLGDPLAICDRCNGTRYHSQMSIEERTGLFVCEDCWDPVHPLEETYEVTEDTSIENARPPKLTMAQIAALPIPNIRPEDLR